MQVHNVNGQLLLSQDGKHSLLDPNTNEVVFTCGDQAEAVAVSHAMGVVSKLIGAATDPKTVCDLIQLEASKALNEITPDISTVKVK